MQSYLCDLLVVIWRYNVCPSSCPDPLLAAPYWFAPLASGDCYSKEPGNKMHARLGSHKLIWLEWGATADAAVALARAIGFKRFLKTMLLEPLVLHNFQQSCW